MCGQIIPGILGRVEKYMKVILIGYRAAGKSTIGRLLAAKLSIPFRDTDLMVEENMGMPIREIVSGHGWDLFRAEEREAIIKLLPEGTCVIATGGGVILAPENVALLKRLGLVIWINAPLQDVIKRLNEGKQTAEMRPQFTAGNLVQETISVLKERIPLYEKAADWSLDTAGKSALQVAEDIYLYLRDSGTLAKINKSKNKAGNQPILMED
jgi:shikimate kinase